MASSKSGVARFAGHAMAVGQQHGEGSTPSSMSVGTTEPVVTIDCSPEIVHCETVDSDVDENTKNTPTTSDRFPKYVDCNETLMEMLHIKWLAGFRSECRKISCSVNTELYFGLFNFFRLNIVPDMIDCRLKVNKSTLLKSYLEQTMLFFRGYYKTVKKVKGDTLDAIYYDRMSSLLAYYIDLKLMSSQCFKENSSCKIKAASKINTILFVFLDQKLDYMFDSIFQLHYVFCGPKITNLESIMFLVLKKLLFEHPIPKKINFQTYLRYILCFKLLKKIILSSPIMDGSVKKKELGTLILSINGLNVPNDFMSQYKKYNWPNWPKLIMSPNGAPYSIQTDLKNLSSVLYSVNFPIKKCYKDILNDPRKYIPILLKPIEEQCKMLRPDLFAISGKELLKNWNENFDDTLKPLISNTQSCNSFMTKIKFNLYTPSKDVCLKIDDKIDDVHVVPINNDLSKLKHFGEGSENHSLPNIENFSHSDKKSMEKTILINSSTNKIIDESNNGKSNKNEKSPGVALKTLMVTPESFPANVKSQSSEDEMQVNVKKSQLFEKHDLYRNDDVRFNPTLSNNPSRLNYISEISSTSHYPECSNSKGSKRKQCSSFGENSKNKKICRTKSQHGKNVLNCNPNQIIDSNCHNSNIEDSSRVTLNNDNPELDDPKNSHNIKGVSCLTNKPSVEEKKWVTKASHPELSVTAALNLKHTQSNFTVSVKDESIGNSTKIIGLSIDKDGTASPSSDFQWPMKLSPSDLYSQEYKRNSNVFNKYTDDELNQKLSPNETNLSLYKRINITLIQPSQKFQDLYNFIAPDIFSPTFQPGSESIDEKIHSFEIPSQSKESSTSQSYADLQKAYYLFTNDKLILCLYPNCTNRHHFPVIFSNAEILRHVFTVQFDYFRYHIQCKYQEMSTKDEKIKRPITRKIEQLNKRCLCKHCCEFDSSVNLNQETLHSYYTEGKCPSIEKDNCKKERSTNTKLSIDWKKRLAQRFTSAEYVEKCNIFQLADEMERHIKHFKRAFTIIFPLKKYVQVKLHHLRKACNSYSVTDDSNK